jgi:Domain of unknown function (DUF1874).
MLSEEKLCKREEREVREMNETKENEDTFRKIYVSDRFDFEMFAKLPSEVVVDEEDISDFCYYMDYRYEDGDVKVAITDENVIRIVNLLCGTQIKKNADRVKLKEYDDLYVVLIKDNIEQGKELSAQEVRKMYKEGKNQNL